MKRLVLALVSCTVVCLIFPIVGRAHPADMYYHTHTVTLTPEGIDVSWEIAPGPMIAQNIWFNADQDQDNQISSAEAEAWAEDSLGTFSAEWAGESLALDLVLVRWPTTVENLIQGQESIVLLLRTTWPKRLENDALLTLHNRFNPKSSLSWFEVRAKNGISFEQPVQNSGSLELLVGPAPASSADRMTDWESGSPTIPWVVETVGLGGIAEEAAAESQKSPAAGQGPVSILEGLIKRTEISPGFMMGALSLAALLGALHALSPGHGKTIVAAYLVGSQGKAYHAIALGAIVTLTHTGSVFALGLLTLTASRYFFAANLLPFLELSSGILIGLLGFILLIPRLKRLAADLISRKNFYNSTAGTSGTGKVGARRLMVNQPVQEIGPPHQHDPVESGAVPRIPAQGNPLGSISWRSLIPLAISGGLVPCPDAIAILLVAATINRMAFGLSLIVSFSLGLAVVLIVIGLLILQGKKLFERLRWFNQAALVMPVLSAGIVFGAGVALSVSAFQNFNVAFTQKNWRIPTGVTVNTFQLAEADILYIAQDENQQTQLHSVPASGGPQEVLTTGLNIWYFAVSPDARLVALAGGDGANGSGIWIWDAISGEITSLLDCAKAYCSELTWTPDGKGLLYSRLEFNSETNPANVQTIWWLNIENRETAPLFQDALTPGFSPRWSPDGQWLSYTSINPLEIKIYHLETGERKTLPSGLGYPPVWSPDSDRMILQDIDRTEGGYLNKLFLYELEDERLAMLNFGESYDDSFPAWSPDGQYLAVVRRAWIDGVPQSGNQIWVMRPDGTEARQLTDVEEYIFGQPRWSSDNSYLLFDFRDLQEDQIQSGIQILNLTSGKFTTLTDSGSRPAWLE